MEELLQLATAAGVVFLAARSYVSYKRYMARRDDRLREMAKEESFRLQKEPRVFTSAELKEYAGHDVSRPLLLALKGRVLDVTNGVDYYGPEGPYRLMAGKDASKAFAMMSLNEEDMHNDLSGVDGEHMKILQDWYDKLTAKYPTVGTLKTD